MFWYSHVWRDKQYINIKTFDVVIVARINKYFIDGGHQRCYEYMVYHVTTRSHNNKRWCWWLRYWFENSEHCAVYLTQFTRMLYMRSSQLLTSIEIAFKKFSSLVSRNWSLYTYLLMMSKEQKYEMLYYVIKILLSIYIFAISKIIIHMLFIWFQIFHQKIR